MAVLPLIFHSETGTPPGTVSRIASSRMSHWCTPSSDRRPSVVALTVARRCRTSSIISVSSLSAAPRYPPAPAPHQPDDRIGKGDRHADDDLHHARPVVAALNHLHLVGHHPDVDDHVQHRRQGDY